MKRWYLLALLATIFLGLGIVLPIALYASGDRQWVLIVITAVTFGGCGLLMAWFVPPTRREEIQGLDDLAVVSPGAPPEPGRPTPWTLAQVAAELARTLEPTPYVVEASATRVRVRADLADARFLTGATIRDVERVFVTDIVPKGGGRAALLDSQQEAEWAVGPRGDRVLALRASASIQGGKSWTWSRRTEYGVGQDGSFGRRVDYSFSSSEIHAPITDVLAQAGWKPTWPAEAKGAAVMAAIGASSIVLVPLAFLIKALS